MKTTTAVIALTLLAASLAAAESKYIINAKRLSTSEEAISCNNGGDPTGKMIGKTLIISCGQ